MPPTLSVWAFLEACGQNIDISLPIAYFNLHREIWSERINIYVTVCMYIRNLDILTAPSGGWMRWRRRRETGRRWAGKYDQILKNRQYFISCFFRILSWKLDTSCVLKGKQNEGILPIITAPFWFFFSFFFPSVVAIIHFGAHQFLFCFSEIFLL